MALFAHNIFRRFLFTPAPVLKLQNPKKNVVIKAWPYMTNALKPSTIDRLKTTDVPSHFKKPKLLKQLSGFNLIQSKKLSLDGYKCRNSRNFYLDADGNNIEIVKDKELAKLILTTRSYHEKDDPKKRLIVTSVKSKIPEFHKGCSKVFLTY